MKNILIIGSTSELADYTIKELKKEKDVKIYATSRQTEVIDEKVENYFLDVTNIDDFLVLKDKLKGIEFDTIINFTGIAIAAPVVELNEVELRKQLDINLFGFLKIIKHLSSLIKEKGKLINVSSMASYGVFPYISPYCLSKASADILLNLSYIETLKDKNIKVVSIRPGAVATKFWDTAIELNQETLKNKTYKKEKEFIKNNAQYNSLHAKNPINVSKKIAKIIMTNNPKAIYNIGFDAKIAAFTRFLPQKMVNDVVSFCLKTRVKKSSKFQGK